jgi:hypothetical protein
MYGLKKLDMTIHRSSTIYMGPIVEEEPAKRNYTIRIPGHARTIEITTSSAPSSVE